uniref:Ribosomal protein S16 n=1 Tax=Kumanoa americana TaxID=1196377 RepID=A0A1C9CGT3_9FLOR|nr:ribosomal protein S16 [Kumanoa americana]AOM67572.1 ribosomal protein S16 [Kumanoa americana]
MLKIRLKKYGRKKQPSYRIVVIDNKKRRDGRPIEEIGFYNPLSEKRYINYEKMEYYKQNGAQMSKTVKLISKNHTLIH